MRTFKWRLLQLVAFVSAVFTGTYIVQFVTDAWGTPSGTVAGVVFVLFALFAGGVITMIDEIAREKK